MCGEYVEMVRRRETAGFKKRSCYILSKGRYRAAECLDDKKGSTRK